VLSVISLCLDGRAVRSPIYHPFSLVVAFNGGHPGPATATATASMYDCRQRLLTQTVIGDVNDHIRELILLLTAVSKTVRHSWSHVWPSPTIHLELRVRESYRHPRINWHFNLASCTRLCIYLSCSTVHSVTLYSVQQTTGDHNEHLRVALRMLLLILLLVYVMSSAFVGKLSAILVEV